MALAQGLNRYDSMAAEGGDAQTRSWLARNEELAQIRAPYDEERRQISAYIFPRRNFDLVDDSKNFTRMRRLVDPTAMITHERLGGMIFSYLTSPGTPWIRPELLERDMTYAEQSWADAVARGMHRELSGSTSTFRTQMAEDVDDLTAFGDSIMWQQPSPTGSTYLSIPNKNVRWGINELGVVNEIFRDFPMTLRRACLRYPNSVKLRELHAKTQRPEALTVNFLHIVEVRDGGVKGDLREIKPWRDIVLYPDGMEVLEIGGHDRNPLNVGRFKRRSGESYGTGIGWTILPLIKLTSMMFETWGRNAELTADPPLLSLMPKTQPFDRRPGAMNYLNTLLAVGIRDPKDVIQRITVAGDIGITPQLINLCWNKIEQAGYVDWMSNDGPVERSAAATNDKRDLRLSQLGPIVARTEHEKMGQVAENTFEDMMAKNRLPRPPPSLHNELIGYRYTGPMANAQRQGEMDGIQRFVALQQVLAQGDPQAARMLKAEPILRRAASSFGLEAGLLASPEEMEAFRQGQQQAGDMQETIQKLEAGSRALQAGGQGISNLAPVLGMQPGGTA